jgi:cutinase
MLVGGRKPWCAVVLNWAVLSNRRARCAMWRQDRALKRRWAELIVISRLFAATGVIASALLSPLIAIPIASAAPCPDVELVFARGTFEPPGVGGTGEAFVESLRSKLGSKSLDVYPVDYPASLDFQTAADGVIDASNKAQAVAAECPETKIVLGGFSQGAAVAGYLTADSVPAGFAMPAGLTGPMPPAVADHVAAVALFGKPSSGFLQVIANTAPPITVGHLYAGKTTDMCIPDDPICSPGGGDSNAHNLYPANGLTDQAADFVAQKVSSSTPKTEETAR